MGVQSLKIEGRTKSHFYVARTVQSYRAAIDLAAQGKAFDRDLLQRLDSLANRGYTDGFYQRHKPQQLQNYHQGYSTNSKQQFVGEVIQLTADQRLRIHVKNKITAGDIIELMLPAANIHFEMQQMRNSKGHEIDTVAGSGHEISIPKALIEKAIENTKDGPINFNASDIDFEFALLIKHIAA